MAITKLTMLSERQTNHLIHGRINELLPPFINLGILRLDSGMQVVPFTATSTTTECQPLSSPMYGHRIPCNKDNQNIVSMGINSALITKRAIDNSFQEFTMLFMTIAQAIDRIEVKKLLSSKSHQIYDEIRSIIPKFTEDRSNTKSWPELLNTLKLKE